MTIRSGSSSASAGSSSSYSASPAPGDLPHARRRSRPARGPPGSRCGSGCGRPSRLGRVVALVGDRDHLVAEAEREQRLGGRRHEARDPHRPTMPRATDAKLSELTAREGPARATWSFSPTARSNPASRTSRAGSGAGDAIVKTFELADFVGSVEFVDAARRAGRGHGPPSRPEHLLEQGEGLDHEPRRGRPDRERLRARAADRRHSDRRRDARCVHVVGTRPNLVKMAPVIGALRRALPGLAGRDRPHRPALRPADVRDLPRGARGARARPPARGRVREPRGADRAGAGAARAGARATSARTWCSSRATSTRPWARRCARRSMGIAVAPSRVGPAELRPRDARGDQPDRHRPPLGALLPALATRRSRTFAPRASPRSG